MKQLTANDVRLICTHDFGVETTEQIIPVSGVVGQDHALRALEFGLGIRDSGFNVFVAGEPGTGRSTAIIEFLAVTSTERPTPPDWCYVHNFKDSYQPVALRFDAGTGSSFAEDVASVLDKAQREMPRVFESDAYHTRREQTLSAFETKKQEMLSSMNNRAREKGFYLQPTSSGLIIVPLSGGKPMDEQHISSLPEDERRRIFTERDGLQSELMDMLRDLRIVDREALNALECLDRDTAIALLGGAFESVKKSYVGTPQSAAFLDDMLADMLENIPLFRGDDKGNAPASGVSRSFVREQQMRRYTVNVLVDNSKTKGAPVVFESNATYANLFGRIEKETQMGVLATDFSLVRPGAFHRANGGFLVIQVEELLRNQLAYEGLKRAIQSREIQIEEAGERMGIVVTKTLRPEPIPLDLKVVLVGTPYMYHKLLLLDPEFSQLFKVKVEFDTDMDLTAQNLKTYASLISRLCTKEGLRHLRHPALARMVQHSMRIAGHQAKLTTRFSEIADVIREASFYAVNSGQTYVSLEHIDKAICARIGRSSLSQQRANEMIRQRLINIETKGSRLGEVNGLAVVFAGDVAFGRPSRISATVGPGREGILDIERAVNLSGSIHSKGIYILQGYLTRRYAGKFPLSLSARVVFEQSYGPVDGDSASSTELYALLSAISGLPVRSGLAVTGSVNQAGEVQAISGVNEKIEGFYEVCNQAGLDGTQGVLIPKSNVPNLMLNEEVTDAIARGLFNVYSVASVDEGIELLTGVSAGEPEPDGVYPSGTVNRLVADRLKEFAEITRQYTR